MGYLSKVNQVQELQLKVQELCVRLNDTNVVSNAGAVATIDVKENIDYVSSALHVKDAAGTVVPVAIANRVISGTTVALTLSVALAASDSIILKYALKK